MDGNYLWLKLLHIVVAVVALGTSAGLRIVLEFYGLLASSKRSARVGLPSSGPEARSIRFNLRGHPEAVRAATMPAPAHMTWNAASHHCRFLEQSQRRPTATMLH